MRGRITKRSVEALKPAADGAEAMLWDETIAAGGYAAKRLDRGARLRLIDLAGDACVSMLVFNAEAPTERLNVADTLKVLEQLYQEKYAPQRAVPETAPK